jgi:hypothetical protein
VKQAHATVAVHNDTMVVHGKGLVASMLGAQSKVLQIGPAREAGGGVVTGSGGEGKGWAAWAKAMVGC